MGLDEAALQALKARVAAFRLDDPDDAVPFSRKLRRETGWSAAYAARVIEEYKRFVILAVAAGHKVSPSKAVDEVWHLHLTDTRRYWDDFCPNVLGRSLHHEPSRGGAGEAEALALQYRATLVAYERLFAQTPPRDIWPSGASRLQRVRRSFHLAGPVAAASLAPLTLVGCAVVDSASPGAIQGPQFVEFYAALAALALLLAAFLQGWATTPRPAPKVVAADLSADELAYLGGGAERLFAVALLRLTQAGHLVITPGVKRGAQPAAAQKALSIGQPLPSDASAADRAIVEAVGEGRLIGLSIVNGPAREVKGRLQRLGLLPTQKARRAVWRIGVAVIGPVLLLGVVRLAFGLSNRRAIAFLVIELGATLLFALGLAAGRLAKRTRWGERLLRTAQAADPLVKTTAQSQDLVPAFALWGLAAVAAGDFADFRHVARAYAPAGGDGGSGGGSCGGGGGGGCGGGGCGG